MSNEEQKQDEQPEQGLYIQGARAGAFAAHSATVFFAVSEVGANVDYPCIADVVGMMLEQHNLDDPADIQCVLAHAVDAKIPGARELWEKTYGPIGGEEEPPPTTPTPTARQAN